jgi:hypothetical protein
LVCSIDNMPTQLPRESTDFFGDLLLPYAMDILKSDASRPLEGQDLSSTVHGVRKISIFKILNYIYFLNFAGHNHKQWSPHSKL